MRKEIENFERIDLFNNFNRDNPFIFLTTKVNITNIYKNCKFTIQKVYMLNNN